VDNIFVFLLTFTYFAVPPAFQKRVLMIGIIGAIVLRTIMILLGAWLLDLCHCILCVFGSFPILTGLQMWCAASKQENLEDSPALSQHRGGEKSWIVENVKRIATPLLMVVALVGNDRRDLRG
jgi:tellurite resistance protein TerC